MTRTLLGLVAAAAVALGCSAGATFVPPTPDIASPVEGVVLSVDAAGLGEVRGFTLRPDGTPFVFTFVMGTLENPTEFPPGHLTEHQASSEPVRVYFRTEGGEHVVYRLEDAGDPPGS